MNTFLNKLKIYLIKKMYYKQFPGVGDRRQKREDIYEIVKFFYQDLENFIEIQVSKGNRRRHYTRFCRKNAFKKSMKRNER